MKRALKIITVLALLSIIYALLSLDDEVQVETVVFEPIPFEAMVAHSIDVAYIEWESAQEVPANGAPYDFLSLDDDLQVYLEERCAEYELDFFIMASLMFSESSFRTSAIGDNGKSVGLFQINKVWWSAMEQRGLDVNDPYDNIEIGLIIFDGLLEKTGDIEKAIQYYKCGESRGRRLWKQGRKLSSIETILERADEWRNE